MAIQLNLDLWKTVEVSPNGDPERYLVTLKMVVWINSRQLELSAIDEFSWQSMRKLNDATNQRGVIRVYKVCKRKRKVSCPVEDTPTVNNDEIETTESETTVQPVVMETPTTSMVLDISMESTENGIATIQKQVVTETPTTSVVVDISMESTENGIATIQKPVVTDTPIPSMDVDISMESTENGIPAIQKLPELDKFYLAKIEESTLAIVKLVDRDQDELTVQFYKSAPVGRGIFRSWGSPEVINISELITTPIIHPPKLPRRSTGDVLIFSGLPTSVKIR